MLGVEHLLGLVFLQLNLQEENLSQHFMGLIILETNLKNFTIQ